ncbi:hypothetical protein TSUD_374500 [Trifolium subterraneum]|uniref:DNA-directed RNA polymerase n=1 Tax=Trifolium subterraneum TaxID=3900 RepID=A0A2Z6P5E2_TRISU|nr:hypothetical protein TSUD_374500 [Trifolium subterraneum]
MDSVIIRSANPYLATPGATIHGHYGEILYQGDILVTFLYEKSRSGDITQELWRVWEGLKLVRARRFNEIEPYIDYQVVVKTLTLVNKGASAG